MPRYRDSRGNPIKYPDTEIPDDQMTSPDRPITHRPIDPITAPRQSRLFTAHLYPTPLRTDRSLVVKFSRMFDLID
ncbi:MAG TPA: hypothetical protein VHI98_24725 [Vicinamibacterales bacterium]|nr:hypothetical protein [Vicinamibacterales bacterium]